MARIAVAGATGRVGRHVVDVLEAGVGGIVAHLDRHFGARAAAERFHLACPLSGDALRPGLRYLQITEHRTSMTLAPPASPIRKGERS